MFILHDNAFMNQEFLCNRSNINFFKPKYVSRLVLSTTLLRFSFEKLRYENFNQQGNRCWHIQVWRIFYWPDYIKFLDSSKHFRLFLHRTLNRFCYFCSFFIILLLGGVGFVNKHSKPNHICYAYLASPHIKFWWCLKPDLTKWP